MTNETNCCEQCNKPGIIFGKDKLPENKLWCVDCPCHEANQPEACDCPKGGMYEHDDGSTSLCEKCNGTEYKPEKPMTNEIESEEKCEHDCRLCKIVNKLVPNMINEIENQIKTEAAVFWAEIESNLPHSREMAALGKEKVYQAFYPAWVEFRKYFLSSQITELLQSLIVGLEGEKAEHIKENGKRKNINHDKDEFWGCCECYEDEWYNKGLNLAQEKLRKLIK